MVTYYIIFFSPIFFYFSTLLNCYKYLKELP